MYERELSDIFAVQADIATNIANALEAEFSPEEQQQLGKQQTSSEAAYRAYLKGRTLGQERERLAAVQALSLAVEIDPEFAAAHA